MSDLISRSEVIEEIWHVFNHYANDGSKFDEYETEAINMAFKVLQNRIEEQPTAYDISKVVTELEEHAVEFELFGICSDYVPKHIAVNAVRKGGVE